MTIKKQHLMVTLKPTSVPHTLYMLCMEKYVMMHNQQHVFVERACHIKKFIGNRLAVLSIKRNLTLLSVDIVWNKNVSVINTNRT